MYVSILFQFEYYYRILIGCVLMEEMLLLLEMVKVESVWRVKVESVWRVKVEQMLKVKVEQMWRVKVEQMWRVNESDLVLCKLDSAPLQMD